jgi:hypothetical protein
MRKRIAAFVLLRDSCSIRARPVRAPLRSRIDRMGNDSALGRILGTGKEAVAGA